MAIFRTSFGGGLPSGGSRSERLTAEEEKDMARRIRAAEESARDAIIDIDLARAIIGRRPERAERTRAGAVSRLEEAVQEVGRAARKNPELRKAAREAGSAWQEAENLRWRLAMSGRRIAHGEARKLAGPFMDEEDLVQEGYIGLLRAAKRFESGGIAYNVQDLAEEVGIDKERAELLLSQGNTISLEQPVDDGPRPRPLERFLSDDDAPQPDGEAIQGQELARMHKAFAAVLSDRQRFVLTRRYGLDDGEFRTLSEVGKEMGLSRERVRQIEREALIRLRDHSGIRDGALARLRAMIA